MATKQQDKKRTGRSKAGALGGKRTAERYGSEFFKAIGKLGGTARGRNR